MHASDVLVLRLRETFPAEIKSRMKIKIKKRIKSKLKSKSMTHSAGWSFS
jgi:hypothetical protein